jgi:hypothetical protein
MVVHDGVVGTDSVSVGTEWTRNGVLVGTRVRVAIDPPLESQPASVDDPSLSPAARAQWRELMTRAHAIHVEAASLVVELEGKVDDPASVMPVVDLAVALRRALAGIRGAGPFR